MGFSRKITTCLLHLPSPPLALRSCSTVVAMTTAQGRLAASCRPKIQFSGRARAVGLPLAPVLWVSMGCSRHMLHGP